MKKIISVLVAILGFTFISMAQVGNTTSCNGKKEFDACTKKDNTVGQCKKIEKVTQIESVNTFGTSNSKSTNYQGNLSGSVGGSGTLSTINQGGEINGSIGLNGGIGRTNSEETRTQQTPIVTEKETGLECR